MLDTLPLLRWAPVEPDGELVDGSVVPGSGGLRVIHTPGHVVLLHEPLRLPVDVAAVGFAHGTPLIGADVGSYQTWQANSMRL